MLVACERSGTVRDAFRKRGHDAWSCDLAPAEDNSKYHVQGDVLWGFNPWMAGPWDLLIAHPPCTYLSSSGLHWNKRRPERAAETEAGLSFALKLWALPFAKACMENPVGRLTKVMRIRCELIQSVQPYQFGHDASKQTCLVLRNLPKLREELQSSYPVGMRVLYRLRGGKDAAKYPWQEGTVVGYANDGRRLRVELAPSRSAKYMGHERKRIETIRVSKIRRPDGRDKG